MKVAERFEDMSPLGRLRVFWDDDGDVIVAIVPDPNESDPNSVEFCIPGSGGGQSTHTHRALIELVKAMERDNDEKEQWRGSPPRTVEDFGKGDSRD